MDLNLAAKIPFYSRNPQQSLHFVGTSNNIDLNGSQSVLITTA